MYGWAKYAGHARGLLRSLPRAVSNHVAQRARVGVCIYVCSLFPNMSLIVIFLRFCCLPAAAGEIPDKRNQSSDAEGLNMGLRWLGSCCQVQRAAWWCGKRIGQAMKPCVWPWIDLSCTCFHMWFHKRLLMQANAIVPTCDPETRWLLRAACVKSAAQACHLQKTRISSASSPKPKLLSALQAAPVIMSLPSGNAWCWPKCRI